MRRNITSTNWTRLLNKQKFLFRRGRIYIAWAQFPFPRPRLRLHQTFFVSFYDLWKIAGEAECHYYSPEKFTLAR